MKKALKLCSIPLKLVIKDKNKLMNFPVIKRLVFRIKYKEMTRKYIPYELGIESFFKELKRRNVEYVILRWFEKLPEWPKNEDIDMLIKDEDLKKILDLFNDKPIGIPCDTYAVYGSKGSNFGKGPYYPSYLAKKILSKRVLKDNTYYIPNKECHFFSLVYHVVYHKGEKAGLPIDNKSSKIYDKPEHDYSKIISSMANELQLPIKTDLYSLHNYLKKTGWSPNIDTLRKLVQKNNSTFVNNLIPTSKESGNVKGDLIVFILREWVLDNKKKDEIIEFLKSSNINILEVKELNRKEQKKACKSIRGGNWDKGPYPISGGLPSIIVIAYDTNPSLVPDKKKGSHPYVVNGNVFVKNEIRNQINKSLLRNKRTNCIHSSDDELEAWEYIYTTCPELIEPIKKRIRELEGMH